MKKRFILILSSLIILVGCTKPQPGQDNNTKDKEFAEAVLTCSGKYKKDASAGLKAQFNKIQEQAKAIEIGVTTKYEMNSGFKLTDFQTELDHKLYKMYQECMTKRGH